MTTSPVFQDSLDRNAIVFPDLPQKLERFIDVKADDPLRNRYGKHDSPMTGPLKGFYHTHLRDDAILIYKLKDKAVNLVYVCPHAEIEGKRARTMREKLSAYN
jgi:mRNA-degrading endonuclease YafQ of YafQ-DinJ toxin-antitoxin module